MILPVYTLWRRELTRFFRQPSRIAGAVATPLLFWLLMGSGLSGSFRLPGGQAGQSYFGFFFPGTIVLVLLFAAIFSNISVIEDRHEGFLQGVLVAPVSRTSLVMGKVLGGATLAWLQGVVFLVLAPVSGIHLTVASTLAAAGVLALLAVTLTALGFFFAWKLDSVQGFHAIMNVVLLPMWLLSGGLLSPERRAALALAADAGQSDDLRRVRPARGALRSGGDGGKQPAWDWDVAGDHGRPRPRLRGGGPRRHPRWKGGLGMALPMRRGLLWGLLVAVLVIVVAATAVERLRRPEPLPVLWNAPDFKLTNRDGRTVTLKDLAGVPWVADFIFTRCPASCPMMTARPRPLRSRPPPRPQDAPRLLLRGPEERHSRRARSLRKILQGPRPLALSDRRRRADLPPLQGRLQAGDRQHTAAGATAAPTQTAEPILHSTRIALVDGQGRVRGYYEAFDEESMKKLERDLKALGG